MHGGTTDPRELQRRSARARSRPKAERVNPSLREFLKREVPAAEVWNALKLALEGSSESARVSAARVAPDPSFRLLHEKGVVDLAIDEAHRAEATLLLRGQPAPGLCLFTRRLLLRCLHVHLSRRECGGESGGTQQAQQPGR
jgi:hypothetical protein